MTPTLNIAQDERRRHPRLAWRAKLTALSFLPDSRRLDALEAIDISFSGMGAVSRMQHEIGQRMVVGLPREDGNCSYITAKVVRCQQCGEFARLGLEFKPEETGAAGPWSGSAA